MKISIVRKQNVIELALLLSLRDSNVELHCEIDNNSSNIYELYAQIKACFIIKVFNVLGIG